MNRIILLLMIGILTFTLALSCEKASEELVIQNLPYGKDTTMQVMDVYLTANRTKQTPLIVLVHGGGWMAGDKKDADFMAEACFRNGINVVNINYRLATENIHYKEIMSDIDDAISFLFDNADEWNIRKDKYVFWGGSAGAHLSMLYAYNYDSRKIISSVITLGGPTKLDDLSADQGVKQSDLEGLLPLITGASWNDDPTLLSQEYKNASPYYGKRFVPTFLVHGEKDDIVPVSQSKVMKSKLMEHNVADTLVILPNGGHGGENTPLEFSEETNKLIYNWIIKYSN